MVLKFRENFQIFSAIWVFVLSLFIEHWFSVGKSVYVLRIFRILQVILQCHFTIKIVNCSLLKSDARCTNVQ